MSALQGLKDEIEQELSEYQTMMGRNESESISDLDILIYDDIKRRMCKKHKISVSTYDDWICGK